MPAVLQLDNGTEEKVIDTVEVAKKKRLAGGFQSFTTLEGNTFRVRTEAITKITSIRA